MTNTSTDVTKEMAQQLEGFRELTRFRMIGYKVALVVGAAVGIYMASHDGTYKMFTTILITIIFGLASVRVLTTPVALFLWYKSWRCPACKKRLGVSVVADCQKCGAKLFDFEANTKA